MKQAIVITGSAGGIGEAVCLRSRRDGFYVIGIDRLASEHADVELIVDLQDAEHLVSVAGDLDSKYEIKALVHNAAVQPLAGAGETTVAAWRESLAVNVIAVDALVSGIRFNLAANNGSVVVISSVHARATTTGIAAYATSKAALHGWVRAAALDLGPQVRVNAIEPGAIDTPKLREGFGRWGEESAERRLAVLRDRTPLGRIGEPSDVAAAVAFLVGDDSRFITGSVLTVDGGATARLGSE